MNFEISTRDVNFGFNEEHVARRLPERVLLCETKGRMEHFSVESYVGGYRVYKARTTLLLAYLNERYWPHFLVIFMPCSLLCSLPSPHARQLESLRNGTLQIKGTVNRAQVAKKELQKCHPVQMLACVDRAAVWVENFVGGKFCDTGVG